MDETWRRRQHKLEHTPRVTAWLTLRTCRCQDMSKESLGKRSKGHEVESCVSALNKQNLNLKNKKQINTKLNFNHTLSKNQDSTLIELPSLLIFPQSGLLQNQLRTASAPLTQLLSYGLDGLNIKTMLCTKSRQTCSDDDFASALAATVGNSPLVPFTGSSGTST